MTSDKKIKICYFGIYRSDFGRNQVYMNGLRQNNVEIIECHDDSSGLKKYWRLWRKHWAIRKSYDYMIVGYPGHMVVPFAKMISRKPVIFDALCTLYEGEVISRGKHKFNFLAKWWINFIDQMAVKFADLILVETNAQREYFLNKFWSKEIPKKTWKKVSKRELRKQREKEMFTNKIVRVFTGADESIFYEDPAIKKHTIFTVLFRGRLLPEAGIKYVVEAAKILEQERINFLIIGGGLMEKELADQIEQVKTTNLEWIKEYLPGDELRERILECHVSLGQMSDHERLSRTIPHKAFETLSMAMPYITARTAPIEEIFTDKKDCLFVEQANAKDLALKIKELKDAPDVAANIAKAGKELYEKKLTPAILAREILNNLATL